MTEKDATGTSTIKPEEILGPDDLFQFACHNGLDCFTNCCRDVTIFLTPYDVMRMRRHLGIGSRDFLDKYTLISQSHVIPLVLLRMEEEREKRCHFVTEQGCTIYEDRPWACRMFPLDLGDEGGTASRWRSPAATVSVRASPSACGPTSMGRARDPTCWQRSPTAS